MGQVLAEFQDFLGSWFPSDKAALAHLGQRIQKSLQGKPLFSVLATVLTLNTAKIRLKYLTFSLDLGTLPGKEVRVAVFVVMNRIPVKPEYAEQFEEVFRTRARLVDRMPGFLRNLVLRPQNPEDPYIVMTFWESEEAFRAWTESPEFREGHGRRILPKEAFRGPNRLETFTALLGSEGERG